MNIDLEKQINDLKDLAQDFYARYDLTYVKSIYGGNDNYSIELAEVYLQSLNNLSINNRKETTRKEIIDEAKSVYEQYKVSENVARYYLSILERPLLEQKKKMKSKK